jgi:subtilase family serine protease
MCHHQTRLYKILFALAFSLAHATSLKAQSRPRATSQGETSASATRVGKIDEGSLLILKGNRHPLAVPSNDRGEVAPDLSMQRMLLVLQRDAIREAALQELLTAQQDKSSPSFHAWLSPDEFGARFGTAKSDMKTVSAWLESHGFHVNRMARGGMAIEFSGTAGQVKEAFHTSIHSYVVEGKTHYANAIDPQIPSALAPLVSGVSTLHNFEKRPLLRVLGTATRIGNTSSWQPNFTYDANGRIAPAHYLAPGDFAKIYSTTSLYSAGTDGTGQSIAIVARSNINLSDMEIFRIAFGLPMNNPQVILDGPDPGNLFGIEEAEADLDTEWSGAIAPKATIKLVVSASTSTTDGVDLSAQYIVDNNLAPIMSTSFGQCEANLGAAENIFFNNLWEQAAAQGITVIVSSGDQGPGSCQNQISSPPVAGVNGLASTPFNIAVGGTQFNENGGAYWSATNGPDQSSVLGYIPEQAWDESCFDLSQCFFLSAFASGGGPSSLYPKPSWQAGPGVPADGKRDLPDVSLDAGGQHDGFLLCQDGICVTDSNGQLINAEVVGGTSASAPAFAGMMALIIQKVNARQGQVDFVLYPLAAAQNLANCNSTTGSQAGCIFNDISAGNTNVPGVAGYPATVNYDLATGWGSINAANLAANWTNVTFSGSTTTLKLSPTATTHGQPITASVTVAPSNSAVAQIPTGPVALLTSGAENQNLGVLTSTGTVSAPIMTLPGGTYFVSASYGGDAKFAASTSTGVTVTINPEPSTLTFTTSAATTTYSAFLFLQASVAGASGQGTATGTVTFSDDFNGNITTLTSLPLNSHGNMEVPETTLAVGTHTITANYSGDPSFLPSPAGPVTVTVNKGPTNTFLFVPTGAFPNTNVFLQAIVFATQGIAVPTGTVQFFDGTNALGNPVPVTNQIATLATTQLALGANSITATYSGDGNFNNSTAPAVVVFVGNPDFQLSVNPGNLTVSASAPGTSTVFATPGPGLGFAGNVAFSCSGVPNGTSCSFQPTQLTLDGFTPASTKLTITKGSAQGALRPLTLPGDNWANVRGLEFGSALCLVFLAWFAKKQRWNPSLCATICFFLLGAVSGCSGSGGSSSFIPGGGTNSGGGTSSNPAVVTVTATGTTAGPSGAITLTHNVTLSVTVQ